MQQKQVYLISPAGYPNLGDEWIAHIRIEQCLAESADLLVYLDCPCPDMFMYLFPKYRCHPRVRIVCINWRWYWELQQDGVWAGLEKIDGAVNSTGHPRTPGELLWKTQLQSDNFRPSRIEVLGGGYVNDMWPTHGLVLGMAVAMKARLAAELSWRQCSVMPMSNTLLFDLTSTIGEFDNISTRDAASSERLAAVFPRVQLQDDAVMSDLQSPRPILRKPAMTPAVRPHVYINLGRDVYSAEDFSSAFDRLVVALRPLMATHQPIYLVANPVADHVALDRLRSIFRNMQAWDLPRLIDMTCNDNVQWLIPEQSTAIVSRFHLRMYLGQAGVLGRYFSMGTYYVNKHASIERYGLLSSWKAI